MAECLQNLFVTFAVQAEDCSKMFQLGREHVRKVAEYVKKCNAEKREPCSEVLFDAQATIIMFCVPLSGGTRREVSSGMDVNNLSFKLDAAGNVVECRYTIPFEKTTPERVTVLLPLRLAVLLYFQFKVRIRIITNLAYFSPRLILTIFVSFFLPGHSPPASEGHPLNWKCQVVVDWL